eukprot:3483-Eustigmatos_ZCMA.PRE.1
MALHCHRLIHSVRQPHRSHHKLAVWGGASARQSASGPARLVGAEVCPALLLPGPYGSPECR